MYILLIIVLAQNPAITKIDFNRNKDLCYKAAEKLNKQDDVKAECIDIGTPMDAFFK